MSSLIDNVNYQLLYNIAASFRKYFKDQRCSLKWCFDIFPNGCCTNSSVLFGIYLKYETGIDDTFLVLGISGKGNPFNGKRHHWLESIGLNINITSDQYLDSSKGIIMTGKLLWHRRFENILKEPIRPIHTYKDEFSKLYNKIKSELNHGPKRF